MTASEFRKGMGRIRPRGAMRGLPGPRTLAGLALAFALAGCTNVDNAYFSSFANKTTGLDLPATVDFYPDHEVHQVAKNHFGEGQYGLAARYFERAVEVNPANAEAWLGLAASYDRIRRFDLADRAYIKAGELVGHRAEYHNNVGYSYLLRGDVVRAREAFFEAYRIDPNNLSVRNNIALLRDTARRANRD
jgi:Tfp pilus assembly protein PilF